MVKLVHREQLNQKKKPKQNHRTAKLEETFKTIKALKHSFKMCFLGIPTGFWSSVFLFWFIFLMKTIIILNKKMWLQCFLNEMLHLK